MPIATTNSDSPLKHFLIAPHSFFGHVGPAIGLACNLLTLSPSTVITLLIPSNMSTPAREVLTRHSPNYSRLHVVFTQVEHETTETATATSYGAFTTLSQADKQIGPAVKSLVNAYKRLLDLQPLTDALSDEAVASFDVPPSVAIIDVTVAAAAIAILPKLNVAANVHVKLLCFSPLSAQWAMWSEVQEYSGDEMGYMQRCRRIMDAGEESRDAVYKEMIGENEDLIHVPGLPPTCGARYQLQTSLRLARTDVSSPSHLSQLNYRVLTVGDEYVSIMLPVLETLNQWDGLINIWPTCIGKDFQAHNDKVGLQCFQVGPQHAKTDPFEDFAVGPDAQKAKVFLDQNQALRGDHSVLYIAFGTLFFSPSASQLLILLNTLQTLNIPFILSIGGADESTKQKCYDLGSQHPNSILILNWAPQSGILAHKATMAFLTHGGTNSVLGAIACAVPLIQTALAFSHPPLRIGVELKQIRTGYNIGKKTAGGVLVRGTDEAIAQEFTEVFEGLRGRLGRELRARVGEMKVEVEEDREWGESRAAMDKLLAL